MFLDRRLGVTSFLSLGSEFGLVTRDVGLACRNQFQKLRIARGHRLTLRFQTFLPLPRRRDRQTQIINLFECLLLLAPRTLFVLLRVTLNGLVFGQTDGYGNPANYTAFSNINGTFAAGGFYSWSGRDTKECIRPSPQFDSLAAIRRLRAQTYDREGIHTEFGFIAEEVAEALPDVVDEHELVGFPAIGIMPLLVHLCRAVSQIADIVERRAP